MDLSNYIASLSISMSNIQYMQQKDISIMKNAMDTQTGAALNLIEEISETQATAPPSSNLLDVYA